MAGGWNVYGQLLRAQLELLSSAPSSSLPGRVFHRTDLTVGEAYLDNGTLLKRFLLNDQGILVGTSGTAGTNVRVNRSGTGKLQFVLGSDSTAEASDSANVAQISSRIENYATGSIPAAASSRLGQLVYDTSLNVVKWCNGSTWVTILTATTPPTVQKFLSSTGTYTTPAGCTYIRVRMVGGGGGGGAADTNSGTDGGTSTFGTTLLSAGGGIKGVHAGGAGGAGGAGSLGTGPVGLAFSGASGSGGWNSVLTMNVSGGAGGNSVFGGSGGGGLSGSAGSAAGTNTGSGGGGGSSGSASGGGGGGAGGYVDAIITSPLATYAYAVGAAGAPGSAGTKAGGAGAAGLIIVEEYYV